MAKRKRVHLGFKWTKDVATGRAVTRFALVAPTIPGSVIILGAIYQYQKWS